MPIESQDPFRDIEFPPTKTLHEQHFRIVRKASRGTYRFLSVISPMAGTLALILAGVGIYFGYPVYRNYNYTNPKTDGYVAPRSPGEIVSIAEASTVTVDCKLAEDNNVIGSAWAIDLRTSDQKYKTSLITNHHVIEDCLGGKGELTVVDGDLKHYKVAVDILDKENDLAKLSSTIDIDPLYLAQSGPYPGYWVMTYGTADGWIGSVSFGSVMNSTDDEIFLTANISHGNSGGPLLDNEGHVLGTNSWGMTGEQYNGAKSLDAMCSRILKCKYNKGKYYWE